MKHIFRSLFRSRDPLARTTPELVALLRQAADATNDDRLANEYRLSAEALERATTLTQRHGDAPTRDALTHVTTRVELGLREYLDDQFEMLKEQHVMLSDQATLLKENGAAVSALRADFQAVGEHLSDRIGQFEERMSASETDRADIHAELRAAQQERQQLLEQVGQLSAQQTQLSGEFTAFRAEIEELLRQSLSREQIAAYLAMIERHEQALNNRAAGG